MNDSPYGQVIDTRTLRMERLLPAPIDKVWAFLVDSDKRARWLAGGGIAEPGRTIELRFDNSALTGEQPPDDLKQFAGVHAMASRVVTADAPELLVITWQEGSDNVSEVRFELSARGHETHLTLVHSRLSGRSGMLGVASGWHAHLDVLEDVLSERPLRPFWPNFGAKRAAYDKLIPA